MPFIVFVLMWISVQKASCVAEKQAARDCLLEYHYEGQGSSAGSLGCCSLLESDNDLQFLSELGSKFKTLAEICSPPRPSAPMTPQTIVIPEVDKDGHIAGPTLETKPPSIQNKSPEHNQNVSISQSSSSVTGFNGAASSSMHRQSSHSTRSMAQFPPVSPVTTAMLSSPGQMLLLQQQPVYYTTTPVLQPMHYIVQPQLQSTVLLAEAPVTDLQGMILLNESSGNTEHILQGRNTAGTLTLGRTRGNTVVESQGMETWQRSGPGQGMGVRRIGRRIKSEGGASTGQCSIGMLIGGHINMEAAGSEERQRGDKRRTRSTASTDTGFMY